MLCLGQRHASFFSTFKEAGGRTTVWTERLARLKGKKNHNRDFFRAVRLPLELRPGFQFSFSVVDVQLHAPVVRSEEPTLIRVPTKDPHGKIGESLIPVQLPHRLLHYLMQDCGLTLPDSLVRKFWSHMDKLGDAWAQSTQAFRQAAGGLVWTLGLYGDDACMQINNDPFAKIIGNYINLPLFRPKSSRFGRFLVVSLECSKIISTQETLFPILLAIVESCNLAAEEGVLGRRYLVSELRGDQAWFRQLFAHQSWWKHQNVCFRCKACVHEGDLSYLKNDVDNGWESTVRCTREFIVEELPEPECGLVCSSAAPFIYFHTHSSSLQFEVPTPGFTSSMCP